MLKTSYWYGKSDPASQDQDSASQAASGTAKDLSAEDAQFYDKLNQMLAKSNQLK